MKDEFNVYKNNEFIGTESAQIELMKELEKKQPPRQRKEHFEQKIEYSKELIACLKRLK